MSELQHWLDEASDADDFERAILRSGLDAEPPAAKCDEVWASITGALALPITITSATASGALKPAAGSLGKALGIWLGVGKGLVLGLAIYGAASGLNELSQRLTAPHPRATSLHHSIATATTPAVPSPASSSGGAASVANLALISSSEPLGRSARANASNTAGATTPTVAPSTAAGLPSTASFGTPPSAARASQLQAEARALRDARSQLRSGRLSEAFATLEASQRAFSAPELYQEREALLIELLYRSGQAAAAQARANEFLARFPDSPHAEQIRQLARSARGVGH